MQTRQVSFEKFHSTWWYWKKNGKDTILSSLNNKKKTNKYGGNSRKRPQKKAKETKQQNIDTMGAMLYRSSIERWEIAIETSVSNYFYDDQFFGSSIIVDYAHSSRVYSSRRRSSAGCMTAIKFYARKTNQTCTHSNQNKRNACGFRYNFQ